MRLSQVPNSLTIFRILLAVAFPMVSERHQLSTIFVALGTEFLDGFIARRFNWSSRRGEVLDPIADKLFFSVVCLTWIGVGKISWIDLAFLGAREIGIVAIGVILLLRGGIREVKPLKARPLGKVTTVLQYVSFLAIALWNGIPPLLLVLTAGAGLFAAVQYFLLFRQPRAGRN